MGIIMTSIFRQCFATKLKNYIQLIFNELQVIKSNQISINNPLLCPHIKQTMQYMKEVTLTDLGLTLKDIDNIQNNHCSNIYTSPYYDISVFYIPQGKSLPIHDHPHMTVLSKVIHGQLQIRSYTKCNGRNTATSEVKPGDISVSLDLDTIKTVKDDTWLLSPTGTFTYILTILYTLLLYLYHKLVTVLSLIKIINVYLLFV